RPLSNPLPPVEMLSQSQIERLHEASMQILENIGIDFLDEEALDIWARAGAKVDRAAQHVWIDRGLVMEAVDKAPSQFRLPARNLRSAATKSRCPGPPGAPLCPGPWGGAGGGDPGQKGKPGGPGSMGPRRCTSSRARRPSRRTCRSRCATSRGGCRSLR